MKSRMFRLGLSFIVGLGCWIGKAQAQSPDPNVPQMRVFAPLGGLLGPQVPLAGQSPGPLLPQSYHCGQHHDWYGCGGWRAQNVFVFGSCRRFFGEPCAPGDSGERLFNFGRHSGQGNASCPGGCNR